MKMEVTVLGAQMNDEDEMITIPKELYDDLIDDQQFLNCLQSAGVDNWEGYDYAVEEYQSMKDDE